MTQECDSGRRFSGLEVDYARARPGYPPQVVDILRTELGLEPGNTIVDLGAGTGNLSRLLLAAGMRVIAIDPNGPMLSAAHRQYACSSFHPLQARAEQTALADRTVDAAVSAQAFHWFDPAASRAELLRILRPPGRVAGRVPIVVGDGPEAAGGESGGVRGLPRR
jgi:SAM-dependent methyltransferase